MEHIPCKYHVFSSSSSLIVIFFFRSPRVTSIDKRIGPGPIYLPPSPDVYMHKAPKYTMSPSTGLSSKSMSPGPANYSLQVLPGKSAPAYSMGRRYGEDVTPYITTQDLVPCKK